MALYDLQTNNSNKQHRAHNSILQGQKNVIITGINVQQLESKCCDKRILSIRPGGHYTQYRLCVQPLGTDQK